MYGRGHEQGTRKARPQTARTAARDEGLRQAVWKGLETQPQESERPGAIIEEVKTIREKGYGYCVKNVMHGTWPDAHGFVSTQGYDDLMREIESLSKTVRDGEGIEKLREAFRRLWASCKQGQSEGKAENAPVSAVVKKAQRLVETGKVVQIAEGYRVSGDTGSHKVGAGGKDCTCAAFSFGQMCAHRLAVQSVEGRKEEGL